MSIVSIDIAKAHTRIDFDSDDALVQGYLNAAEGYLAKVGVAVAAPIDPTVQQAVLLLTAHLYNNREAVSDVNAKEIPLGVRMFIQALREAAI